MLKHRILTAAVLIPLVLWAILTLATEWLAIIISTVILIGAWEWAALCGWQGTLVRLSYTVLMGLSIVVTYSLPSGYPSGIDYLLYLLAIACLWWLIAGYWVWSYQRGYDRLPVQPWIKGVIGFLILLPTWSALFFFALLPPGKREGLIFLLVLIWTADSAAYFVGRRWGRHKLADKVSPGKTWEGVIGGLLGGLLLAIGYAVWRQFPAEPLSWFSFLGVCLVTVIASILGDLSESLFKRQMGLKDSGQLLPGHGGMLDRIDSLTAAAPVLVAAIYFVMIMSTS